MEEGETESLFNDGFGGICLCNEPIIRQKKIRVCLIRYFDVSLFIQLVAMMRKKWTRRAQIAAMKKKKVGGTLFIIYKQKDTLSLRKNHVN